MKQATEALRLRITKAAFELTVPRTVVAVLVGAILAAFKVL